jgi:hypothetical protein
MFYGLMLEAFLLLHDGHVNEFFLMLRYVNVHDFLDMKMVVALFALDRGHVNMNFPCHGYWDVNDSFHWLVSNLFLWNDNRNMYNFLLLMRDMNINMLLDVEMVGSFLLLDRWHVHDLLNHHRNWYFDHLLHGALMYTFLRNDLGNVHGLMHIPSHVLRHFVNLLDNMCCGDLDDVLVCLPDVVCMILLVYILRWSVHLVTLARGILRCANFPGVFQRS